MSNRLEQFIRDHREDFDSEEPGKKVWENIHYPDVPARKRPASVFRLQAVRWSAAAALVLLIAGATWYIIRQKTGSQGHAMAMTPSVDTGSRKPAQPLPGTKDIPGSKKGTAAPDSTPLPSFRELPPPVASAKKQEKDGRRPAEETNTMESDYREEMFHYVKLVELKHKELKHIEKDEPLLYKEFAGDVNKLDSVYHSLEKRLTTNPNREQLLEAMLQNLQLQMGLLNHQLKIIRQINHSKKTAYENAYKTT
jgi:hypothetical protein